MGRHAHAFFIRVSLFSLTLSLISWLSYRVGLPCLFLVILGFCLRLCVSSDVIFVLVTDGVYVEYHAPDTAVEG